MASLFLEKLSSLNAFEALFSPKVDTKYWWQALVKTKNEIRILKIEVYAAEEVN